LVTEFGKKWTFLPEVISKKVPAKPDTFLRRGEACLARKAQTPSFCAKPATAGEVAESTPPFHQKRIRVSLSFFADFNRQKVEVYFLPNP
jgi:hypothetical protein